MHPKVETACVNAPLTNKKDVGVHIGPHYLNDNGWDGHPTIASPLPNT